MRIDHLNRLKAWFDAYALSFLTHEPAIDSPMVLKMEHTARVCDNICHLGRSINLTANQLRIAEAIGLFHDVGRFLQYSRYRTFNDRKSANHSSLGINVLKDTAVFDALPTDDQSMIIDAVRFHNAPALPENRPPASMVFMRLIRDADKLDIWKVFGDCYRYNQQPEAAIVQHLPDLPEWEEKIIRAINEKRMAKFQDMKSLNDFKLLQLSWVFDLNFPETLVQARERGDLAAIASSLPDHHAIRRAIFVVMDRLKQFDIIHPKGAPRDPNGYSDECPR